MILRQAQDDRDENISYLSAVALAKAGRDTSFTIQIIF